MQVSQCQLAADQVLFRQLVTIYISSTAVVKPSEAVIDVMSLRTSRAGAANGGFARAEVDFLVQLATCIKAVHSRSVEL